MTHSLNLLLCRPQMLRGLLVVGLLVPLLWPRLDRVQPSRKAESPAAWNLSWGWVPTTNAQSTADALTLAEALAWGVENNLGIAGQRVGVEVAARNNNWVTAGRAPVVQATLGVNNALNSQDNPAAFLNGTFYNGSATAGLQANYRLFNGYQVRFDKRRLGQLEQQSHQQLRQLMETSVFEVTQAYYSAQLSEAQARVAQQVLQLSQDRLEFEEVRRSYGQGQTVDLLQARTAMFSDSVRVEQARVGLDNAVRALYEALDAPQQQFAGRPLGDTLLFEARDWEINRIAARLDSSAALQLARTQEQLSLIQTELARSALQPTLDVSLGLQHTRNAFKFNGEDPRTGDPSELIFGSSGLGSVGISAAYTLWDAGNRRRNVENAIAQERIASLTVKNTRQDALLQAQTLLATYRNQRELLQLQDALIANAQANLTLASEQLRTGSINSFDYRRLQLDYLAAVQDRLQAVYEILLTDLNLRRLTGDLIQ